MFTSNPKHQPPLILSSLRFCFSPLDNLSPSMEFWGVEVKPKQSVKCVAGDEKILHLSQASLGEIRKDKGSENVPVFVKVNDQKLVLGTLSAENCAQIQYDLVFEKEFELSHGSKDTSVFFVGYKSTMQDLGYPFIFKNINQLFPP
ncbi:Histone deacetylase HDT1 [Platanthera guangdongensis]|uniref:Histone deacetylase HDT1 n=1 Tax=Platanthera guangdongensis TaxID=2320717 RepID=A0ABR2LF17_9ASPA